MEVKKQPNAKIARSVKTERHFVWLWSYIILACIFLTGYFLLRFNVISIEEKFHQGFKNLLIALFLSICILTVSKFLDILIIKKTRTKFKRYNLIRLTKFLTFIAIVILIISFVFSNWYAAAVSLGLISLILGFALQTPISSFIGWIYILIRNPYRIGDRIQLDDFKGDVVEIGYLDTTLWEFAGDYLTNDLPSGRLIRFPNSLILQSTVINYSWRDFQFIWNEIPFHVAYESDLEFLEKTMRDVTKATLGENMQQHIEELRKLVKESPIDDMEIKAYPYVSFRINPNTWVEATVTYLVHPKEAASVRTRIIKQVIDVLIKEPDKAMFPRSNAR